MTRALPVTEDTPPRLVRIVAPHFVAGIETDGAVRRAAPILQYMASWPDDRVRAYVAAKGWRASVVPALRLEDAG